MSNSEEQTTDFFSRIIYGASVGFENGLAVSCVSLLSDSRSQRDEQLNPDAANQELEERQDLFRALSFWEQLVLTIISPEALCPVCGNTPEDPVTAGLSCCHAYCRECLERQCEVADRFPITCATAGCGDFMGLLKLKTTLQPHAFGAMLQNSFKKYIEQHPEDFRYCPTPNCDRVHRYVPKEAVDAAPVTCNGCDVPICIACRTPSHPGQTCAQNTAHHNGGLEEWQHKNDAKNCPGCRVLIEKEPETCSKMQCANCQIFFCWACMATFETGPETYGHMSDVHKDWGVQPHVPDILIFIAGRLGINEFQLRGCIAEAIEEANNNLEEAEHQPQPKQDDSVDENDEGEDEAAQYQGPTNTAPPQNHAFYHRINVLQHQAEYCDNFQEALIGFLEDIADFIEQYPDAAIESYLNDLDRLVELEQFLHNDPLGSDVSARLGGVLDSIYGYIAKVLFDNTIRMYVVRPTQAAAVVPDPENEAAVIDLQDEFGAPDQDDMPDLTDDNDEDEENQEAEKDVYDSDPDFSNTDLEYQPTELDDNDEESLELVRMPTKNVGAP